MLKLRFAAALAFAFSCFAAPRPVILTTDCGADMDDQWALAHLALSPQFDLRAVVTTHTGKNRIFPPPAAEGSARCAREVLDRVPVSHKPDVIPGSSVQLSSRSPLRNAGVDRILSESRAFGKDRRLTVLVIGAATDTASALMVDPSVADRIEVVAMGFKNWDSGDEFNIQNDPIAWQVILDSRTPVTAGDGAVCKRDLVLTSARAHSILDPAGASGRYLAGLLDDWLQKHGGVVKGVTGDEKKWPVWDEVTVAHLLGMTKGEVRPRPKLRDDLSFDHSATEGKITWVTAIDSGRLWGDLVGKLEGPPRDNR